MNTVDFNPTLNHFFTQKESLSKVYLCYFSIFMSINFSVEFRAYLCFMEDHKHAFTIWEKFHC